MLLPVHPHTPQTLGAAGFPATQSGLSNGDFHGMVEHQLEERSASAGESSTGLMRLDHGSSSKTGVAWLPVVNPWLFAAEQTGEQVPLPFAPGTAKVESPMLCSISGEIADGRQGGNSTGDSPGDQESGAAEESRDDSIDLPLLLVDPTIAPPSLLVLETNGVPVEQFFQEEDPTGEVASHGEPLGSLVPRRGLGQEGAASSAGTPGLDARQGMMSGRDGIVEVQEMEAMSGDFAGSIQQLPSDLSPSGPPSEASLAPVALQRNTKAPVVDPTGRVHKDLNVERTDDEVQSVLRQPVPRQSGTEQFGVFQQSGASRTGENPEAFSVTIAALSVGVKQSNEPPSLVLNREELPANRELAGKLTDPGPVPRGSAESLVENPADLSAGGGDARQAPDGERERHSGSQFGTASGESPENSGHPSDKSASGMHPQPNSQISFPVDGAISPPRYNSQQLESSPFATRVWESAFAASGVEVGPANPLKEIDLRLPIDNSMIDVQLRERAGTLDVSVRTSDAALAREMQSGLGDLVRNLEAQGYGAVARRGEETLDVSNPLAESGADASFRNSSQEGSTNGESLAGGQGGQQGRQQSRRNRHQNLSGESLFSDALSAGSLPISENS